MLFPNFTDVSAKLYAVLGEMLPGRGQNGEAFEIPWFLERLIVRENPYRFPDITRVEISARN
jgi:hypothetical protein